jgi:DNA-directed RNA polymerase alpha subunit
VREDVTDIVLNVKQIALKMQGEGPKRLQLSATGPGEVRAGDIAVTGDIEVMNKDLVICHLDEGAAFNMELTADTGKGYVPAVSNRRLMRRSASFRSTRSTRRCVRFPTRSTMPVSARNSTTTS